MTNIPTVDSVAHKVRESTLFYATPNQYQENSIAKIAYEDGVKTAAAFVYIDLSGTSKSKGILTQDRQTHKQALLDKVEGMKIPDFPVEKLGGDEHTMTNRLNENMQMGAQLGYRQALDDITDIINEVFTD